MIRKIRYIKIKSVVLLLVFSLLLFCSCSEQKDSNNESQELKKIDTNGNGVVTIAEAKAAGYTMPISSDFWLYKYMIDANKDGFVGEYCE